MAKETSANPYLESSFLQLVDAAKRAARAMREETDRTSERYQAMAARATSLLGMLAYRLEPSMNSGEDPEKKLAGAVHPSVHDEFRAWYEVEAQRALHVVREITLLRAAAFVLGRDAKKWYAPREGAFDTRPNYRVFRGDEELYAMLRELEHMAGHRES